MDSELIKMIKLKEYYKFSMDSELIKNERYNDYIL